MIDERLEEQASLHVLGALSDTEAREFKQKLRADPELQEYVARLSTATSALAGALPVETAAAIARKNSRAGRAAAKNSFAAGQKIQPAVVAAVVAGHRLCRAVSFAERAGLAFAENGWRAGATDQQLEPARAVTIRRNKFFAADRAGVAGDEPAGELADRDVEFTHCRRAQGHRRFAVGQ
jgi:anti-sigma factor RsiW